METKQQIKARRVTLSLSQGALAARLQVLGLDASQQRVSNWETGRFDVPADVLPFLAAALECDPNWLVNWEHFRKRRA